ncbi:MAG: hypothetical protein HFJ06_13230 [Lachnospiraceae bacterium]|nr:hypothetical protein [Lachnospiraceae bacterium]
MEWYLCDLIICYTNVTIGVASEDGAPFFRNFHAGTEMMGEMERKRC